MNMKNLTLQEKTVLLDVLNKFLMYKTVDDIDIRNVVSEKAIEIIESIEIK